MIIFKRYKNRGRRLGKQRKLALARSVASSAFFNIIACGVDVATGAKIEITHQREVQYQHWRHNVWAQKSQHSCWLSDMCLEQHIFRAKRP